jgi:hypothetical protein
MVKTGADREPLDPVEVVAQPRDQRHGFLILDQRVRALRFHRPEVKRNELGEGTALAEPLQSWAHL